MERRCVLTRGNLAQLQLEYDTRQREARTQSGQAMKRSTMEKYGDECLDFCKKREGRWYGVLWRVRAGCSWVVQGTRWT